MNVWIRGINDWNHKGVFPAISWDIPVFSDKTNDSGTVVIDGEVKDYTGQWLIIDSNLYLITKSAPKNGQTTLTITSAVNAFDRMLIYSGDGTEYFGTFLCNVITSEYIEQEDALYSMPYLSVTSDDATQFNFPTENNETYTLAEIFELAQQNDVVAVWKPSDVGLVARFEKLECNQRVVLFGDGHNILNGEAYNNKVIAKTTVNEVVEDKDGNPSIKSTATFYWHADGSVSETAPEVRIPGSWTIVSVDEGEDKERAAIEEMADNTIGYKIEFFSEREFNLHDVLTIKTDSGVQIGTVSYKRKSSKNERNYYIVGNAITTLTEKLDQIEEDAKGKKKSSGKSSGGGGGASSWTQLREKPFSTLGTTLKSVAGVLDVDVVNAVQQNNMKPITSAAVYTEVGNINALLSTI